MSRPKSKAKGRTLPMSSMNGDHAPQVPPDLVWDEDNHPVIFQCSQHTEHVPTCNGNCPSMELDTENQVEILNEARRFARAGMSFQGVPTPFYGQVPGILVELVDVLMWLEAAKQLIIDKLDVSQFEFEETYREKKIAFLREIRETNEAAVRRQRMQQFVPKRTLLGPDGGPIH